MGKAAKIDEAAKEFFAAMIPAADYGNPGVHRAARDLVRAAFSLYAREWPQNDIRGWRFPYDGLAALRVGNTSKVAFPSDQPWTVLLRRAAELAG